MTDPAEKIENKASVELELIAADYKEYADIYEKIIAYVKVVKELETYVVSRKV